HETLAIYRALVAAVQSPVDQVVHGGEKRQPRQRAACICVSRNGPAHLTMAELARITMTSAPAGTTRTASPPAFGYSPSPPGGRRNSGASSGLQPMPWR